MSTLGMQTGEGLLLCAKYMNVAQMQVFVCAFGMQTGEGLLLCA